MLTRTNDRTPHDWVQYANGRKVLEDLLASQDKIHRRVGEGRPGSFLYRTMVEVTLRFLIEEVGQVEGVYPYPDRLAQNFLLQRTASHGIELLGILAFRAS